MRRYSITIFHSPGRCDALRVLTVLRDAVVLSINAYRQDMVRASKIEIRTNSSVNDMMTELADVGCEPGDVTIYDIQGGTHHDLQKVRTNAAE